MLWIDETTPVVNEATNQLLACLSSAQLAQQRMTLKQPLPEHWVTQCIAQQTIFSLQQHEEWLPPPTITVSEVVTNDFSLKYTSDDNLILTCTQDNGCHPCEIIPALKKLGNAVHCEAQQTILDVIATTGSYQKAFIYATDRRTLPQQIAKITHFKTKTGVKVFYIHPTYQDALVRFQFITAMMNMLELFFQPFFLIFLWILLLVQLGMVMTHRQHHYAILLAKGMSWPQVRYLIFTQISLSFLVAIAVAVTITEIMQIILSIQVTDIITKEPYNEHIVAPQLNLLPLFFLDYLKVISLILITLFVATFSLLKVMIAQRYQQPAYLLQ
jgi:hypothetical protein